MDHRARTERARWLAAASIVASIGAAAAVVHLWPGPSAARAPLAARALMLMHPPALPAVAAAAATSASRRTVTHPDANPANAAGAARVASAESSASAADRAATRRAQSSPVPVQHADAAAAPDAPPVTVVVDALADALADAPPSRTPSVPGTIASRQLDPVLLAPVDPDYADTTAVLTPAAARSNGFVDFPATAVTRAVTIAGKGIRSGVRATTAAVRAAF